MQGVYEKLKEKAKALLADGTVNRVLGWQTGEFFYDTEPLLFTNPDELDRLVYNCFCASNQSKYLITETRKEGKVLALLKPCDTYSFNQLLKEHRINRENVYILGVNCDGMVDINKIRALGIKGIKGVREDGENLIIDTMYGEKTCARSDVLLEKCMCCKSKLHKIYDELLEEPAEEQPPMTDRLTQVSEIESMTPDERFAFWRAELSKCIRCNACRNVCPACTCEHCVFDNPDSGISSKAPVDDFEENMFHIIRAFHVAGRCTDCGECSRVCPQNIPLHLLNRKFIKDINVLYGEYQAGEDISIDAPLNCYTKQDCEPSEAAERGRE